MSVKIEQPVVVIVEGISDKKFFEHVCEKWNINNVQFISIDGKDKYKKEVQTIVKLSDFGSTVKVLGVTCDADNDFQKAENNIKNILEQLQLSQKTEFFILPDHKSPGMLESLLIKIADGQRMGCVDDFMNCLKKKKIDIPNHRQDKAKIGVYLSAFKERKPIGVVHIIEGETVWDVKHQELEPLKNFFQNLTSGIVV